VSKSKVTYIYKKVKYLANSEVEPRCLGLSSEYD